MPYIFISYTKMSIVFGTGRSEFLKACYDQVRSHEITNEPLTKMDKTIDLKTSYDTETNTTDVDKNQESSQTELRR